MTFQPDESTQTLLKRQRRVPFHDVRLQTNHPAKAVNVCYTQYFKTSVMADVFPQIRLLVPANPNRIGLGFGGTARVLGVFGIRAFTLSFGPPNPVGNAAGNQTWGFPIALTQQNQFFRNLTFGPIGGTISIDDVYIILGSPIQSDIAILCYESVLSVTGKGNKLQ